PPCWDAPLGPLYIPPSLLPSFPHRPMTTPSGIRRTAWGDRWAESSGLRRDRLVLLGHRDQLVEGLRIVDRDLAEHLPVQQDARALHAVDEAAVGHAAHAAGRRKARDPERPEVALAGAAIAPREAGSAPERHARLLLVTVLRAVVAAGFP